MKKLRLFTLVLLSMIMCVNLTSCGGNSDDGDSFGGSTTKLSGTKWMLKNWDVSVGDDWASIMDETITIYFDTSTEGVAYYGRKDYDTDFGNSHDRKVAHFTYRLVGNQIDLDYITPEVLSNLTRFKLQGNTLVSDGATFIKDSFTSSDYSWMQSIKGQTGDCRWYSDIERTIFILGDGVMGDYSSFSDTPWSSKYRIPNDVVIGEGVTYVGNCAFANPSIANVKLPSSLKKIGKMAFSGVSISGIILPKHITEIGEEAFSGCKYLDVWLPDEIEIVRKYAFLDCKRAHLLSTNRLRIIEDWAFLNCEVPMWTDSKCLESIGAAAFTDCGFSTLELPESVKSLGGLAFTGSKIREIRIGSGLQKVEGSPFCPGHSGRLYINQNRPLSLSDDIVFSDYVGTWTLYVPKGCKKAYSKAPYWRNFKYIYESSELTGDGNSSGNDNAGGNDNGSNEPTPGLWIDLGLRSGVKWASHNVGASSPEEYGDYFTWGETSPTSSYDSENSWTFNKSMSDISGNVRCDAATANWGGGARMPTKAECEELANHCSSVWTTCHGVNGLLVTGPNGNSIFLPAAGRRNTTRLLDAGVWGCYWSSTPAEDEYHSYYLFYNTFHYFGCGTYDYRHRGFGFSVRPVRN